MDYFDYIIVGAGSSGAVVASRIVEKKKYPNLILNKNDKVEIVHFIGGG